MRIGIDGRLWNETGVGRYIRNLVFNLAEIDHQNEYCLFVLSKDVTTINNQLSTIKKNKWKIIPVAIHWHSFHEQVQFPQLLYKEKLDLMHFPYFSLPIGYQRPYIITLHDLILHHFPTGKASTLSLPLYQLKHFAYRRVIAHGVNHARKIIVPLEATKADVVKTLGVKENNIVVTKEGFDAHITSGKNVSDTIANLVTEMRYFLYVGNAYPHKNLDRLFAAFSTLYEKYESQKTKLVLVGKNDYFYQKLKKQYQMNDTIIFLDTVSDAELAFLYQHAVALVSPSLMEGFGLPALEAMASSCLVVASRIPSFQEVCGGAAMYFDPFDSGDIMKKLIAVYNLDSVSRKSRIAEGLERVSLFSWKEMAKQTRTIYESSISIRSGEQMGRR